MRLAAIARYYSEHNYLLDPHTAVGVAVAENVGAGDDETICIATAHPAKFPEAIERATGRDIAHHPAIDRLAALPTRCETLGNDVEAVREFIIQTAS